jgi:hypothetical protein
MIRIPYYNGEIPYLIDIDEDLKYELKFLVNIRKCDIKRYMDFRSKIEKIGYFIIDSDTGKRERKKFNYLYFWVYSKGYSKKKDLGFNFDDYLNYIEYKYPEFLI